MRLNLPILDHLAPRRSILIAGMGGGFDVFCGLPLYFELEALGKEVHLANLSFSDIVGLSDGEEITDTLVGVNEEIEGDFDYFPEFYLAQWFYEERGEEVPIWCFEKTGARPLVQNYRALIEHLEIDAIILIDGGIDSLLRGDEPEIGTMFEDSLSLLAVQEARNIPTKLLACVGLGIETEIGYAHVFENISALIKAGAFLGSCSLTAQMDAYQRYADAVQYAFDQQPGHPSVINASILSAVQGHYGDHHMTRKTAGSTLNISSLMSIYWFFDARKVAERNLLLSAMRLSTTVDDAWRAMQSARASLTERGIPEFPLP
jgi:hypothetical protein